MLTSANINEKAPPSLETNQETLQIKIYDHNDELVPCHRYDHHVHQSKKEGPSNESVLNIAFLSFIGFVVIQSIAAYVAKSEAMLVDCIAMAVDAFTYLFNLIAEKLKHRYEYHHRHHHNNKTYTNTTSGEHSNYNDEEMTEMEKNKHKLFRLYLEFIPPLISVIALITVSLQAFQEAIVTIVNEYEYNYPHSTTTGATTSRKGEGKPDMSIMLIFSALNLVIDFLNVVAFSKAKSFGYNPLASSTNNHTLDLENLNVTGNEKNQDGNLHQHPQRLHLHEVEHHQNSNTLHYQSSENNIPPKINSDDKPMNEFTSLLKSAQSSYKTKEDDDNYLEKNHNLKLTRNEFDTNHNHYNDDDDEYLSCNDSDSFVSYDSDDNKGKLNLNMCSAYTHVMADTLRSIAELLAALASKIFKSLSPEVADASAAIVISIILSISIGPLIVGLLQTWEDIKLIRSEMRKNKESAVVLE